MEVRTIINIKEEISEYIEEFKQEICSNCVKNTGQCRLIAEGYKESDIVYCIILDQKALLHNLYKKIEEVKNARV